MFTRRAHYLAIQSPSSTTVSYTVSNAVPDNTTSSRIFSYARGAIRVLTCISTILFDLALARITFRLDYSDSYLNLLSLGFVENAAQAALNVFDWRPVIFSSFLILYISLRRAHTGQHCRLPKHTHSSPVSALTGSTEESLLVLRGLGIQTSTSSPYIFSTSTTTFIPTTQIQDIVIHEAFKGLEVRFYLAVIVEGATEVVVVFPVR